VSLLVVMGSGETAPTMVRVHRRVFAETAEGLAVLLDTPFGFQRNADELVERTRAYFAESVGHPVDVAPWRRRDAPAMQQERTLAQLHQATWAFAGPGSPTYALRQWLDTPIPQALADVVARGGTLVFGSAAAVTLGAFAIPVYEIYKAGEDPHWAEGTDLLDTVTGLRAVVIPHYDNNEGGTHDTRFCYLGEERLALLEADLPADVGVLGVDEHTALLLDVGRRTATVAGNGVVTVRRRGASTEIEAGTVLPLDDLSALLRGDDAADLRAAPTEAAPSVVDLAPAALSVRDDAERARADFDQAVGNRDVDGCVAAVLGLEEAIHAWGADTLQSDDSAYARRVLRALVVRLGELATVGARDPRSVAGPYVDLLMDLRSRARSSGDFAASDDIRDRLAAIGVEVRDTAHGAEWVLTAT